MAQYRGHNSGGPGGNSTGGQKGIIKEGQKESIIQGRDQEGMRYSTAGHNMGG